MRPGDGDWAAKRTNGQSPDLPFLYCACALASLRVAPARPRPVYLDKVVSGSQLLMRRLLGEQVEIAMRLAGEDAVCFCDPFRLEQALINLAVNGRDAMPSGGTLTLTTGTLSVDEEGGDGGRGLAPGEWVLVEVADTGSGMDERTLAEAFSPIFTTKESGKGTGLGLAVVLDGPSDDERIPVEQRA